MKSEAQRPGRGPNKRLSLHLSVSKQVSDAIEALLATGLYGFSRTDVARRLLEEALRSHVGYDGKPRIAGL